jgi:hypothetical protein
LQKKVPGDVVGARVLLFHLWGFVVAIPAHLSCRIQIFRAAALRPNSVSESAFTEQDLTKLKTEKKNIKNYPLKPTRSHDIWLGLA